MKRIVTLGLALIIFLSYATALDDFTPTTTDTTIPTFQTFDPICSQNAAGISQLITRTDNIQKTCTQCFKETDLEKFETTVDEKFERKIGDILSKMLLLFLALMAFEKAITFIMISRGMLGYGPKKIETPKILQKKPEEKPKEPEKQLPAKDVTLGNQLKDLEKEIKQKPEPIDEMVDDLVNNKQWGEGL